MRRLLMVAAVAMLAMTAACEDDAAVVETPEDVDVDVRTDTAVVVPPEIEVGRDTVTVPDVNVRPGEVRNP